MKKRTKKTEIKIVATGKPGLSSADLQKRIDEESAMQAEMAEIIETDERRNDLESYIFNMRDKICGEYSEFIAEADREKFSQELMKAEDWLYDTEDATKVQYVDKKAELAKTGDAVVWRKNEADMRAEWIKAVEATCANYKEAAVNPGDKHGHIARDKLDKIT